MKIFEALRQDHDRQRMLLRILAETSGDTPARREFYNELKEEIDAQQAAEERYCYSPLASASQPAETACKDPLDREAISKLVDQLDHTEMNSPRWLENLKVLQTKIEEYLLEEEREFFAAAEQALHDSQPATTLDFEAERHIVRQRA